MPPRLAADITDPRLAADITDPQLAADSSDAALDAVPTPSTDIADPMDPIEAKLPTEAMLSTEPRLATDSTESSEAIDHLEAMVPLCHAAAVGSRLGGPRPSQDAGTEDGRRGAVPPSLAASQAGSGPGESFYADLARLAGSHGAGQPAEGGCHGDRPGRRRQRRR